MITWGKVYWPIFLIISSIWLLLGFGIPEAIALLSNTLHEDNTLSRYARSELGINVATAATVHSLAWWLSFIVVMVLFIFLIGHIFFDQFG